MPEEQALLLTDADVGLPPAKPNLNPFQLAAELQQLLDFQEEAETDEERAAAENAAELLPARKLTRLT